MVGEIRGFRKRHTFLAAVLAVCAVSPALGQEASQRRFLPSSIVPNYDRLRIGQNEALEAGAFVARTGDAGSNWYNPAGLALSEGTGLNASANAYEYTTIKAEGLGAEYGSGRFRSIGTFVGGVIGSPILKGRTVRLGFSFTRPVVWSPGTISAAADFDIPGDPGAVETLTSTSKVQMSTSVPAIAAGFRLSDDLRLGAGTSLSLTNFFTSQQFTDRLLSPTEVRRALRSLQLDGQVLQLQFTGSAQWEISDAVILGAMATSPGLRLSGSGLVESQAVTSLPGGGSSDGLFRDTAATFDYKLPVRLVGGVAVRLGRFEIEADVRYHGSQDTYNLIESDVPVRIVITDEDGNPTASEQPIVPLTEQTTTVTNLAIGGNYAFSESFRIHLGFFTDNTPVGQPGTSMFRAVDLTGVSGGVSFGGRLSGSIGISSSWGTTEDRRVGPTLGGEAASTKIGISTFNLHYAISYAF